MSFKISINILKNALIKRKRGVILPNYLNQLLIYFIIKKTIGLFFIGLIALLDPYLSKSCGYGPLTNLNTKQPPMF